MNTDGSATRARLWRPVRVATVCAALIWPLPGQTPIIRTSVNLVLLDVAVFGKDGKPVQGLRKDNFRISDAGRERPIVRFETGAAELSVVFAVDLSRSMRPHKPAVIQALQRLRRQLLPADQMAVIVFSDDVRVLPPAPASWVESLEELTPDGKTAVYDALIESAGLLSRAGHSRRVCVLLSDGLDTASDASRERAIDAVRAGIFTTYTIALFTPWETEADTGFLRKLAGESGGVALFQERAETLNESLDTILNDLRSRYVIGFLTDDPQEGRVEVRDVRLNVRNNEGKGLRVRTRKNYQIGVSSVLP